MMNNTDDTDKNNDSRNELMCEYAFSLGQKYCPHRNVGMKIVMDLKMLSNPA
jgi:hypothetical protein